MNLRKLSFLSALVCNFLFAQTSTLKLEDIMKGEEFIGYAPENPVWGLDSETIYFEWNPKNEPSKSTYFWKKGMAQPQLANPNEARFYKNRFLTFDQQTFYYTEGGAIYSFDSKINKKKKIFQNSGMISNLSLGKPGILYFEQNGNIFKADTQEGSFIQITNFSKKSTEKKPEKDNFLKDQQDNYYAYLND